jgi:tetratricopeptide (TPR) repeat protein
MYKCPACGRSGVAGLSRCTCGADLTILENLQAVVDVWFNRGLAALAEGRPGNALEWLSACCVARPNDAAARLAQARVWAQLGNFSQAQVSLKQAEDLDPGLPGLADMAQALAEAGRQPLGKGPGRRRAAGRPEARGKRRRRSSARGKR